MGARSLGSDAANSIVHERPISSTIARACNEENPLQARAASAVQTKT
jgi:hypothetical protein